MTSLVHVTNRWLKNIDDGKVTGIVFIDLRKAFDTVDHAIMTQKLENFGVKGITNAWFKSYLADRSQVVCLEGEMSDPLPVEIGVPQGSILGPLLFSLYLNDLPSVTTKCNANMYADDTEMDHASKSPVELEETINDDLTILEKYFIRNRLSINVKKCEYMLVGTRQALSNFGDI